MNKEIKYELTFKEVLTKNGFDNDIADYILKQMYCQSYINPFNWECYCNMNNKSFAVVYFIL